ncbi:hypothetical protein ACFSTD_22680 [Novosphingobium colocasiae]
MHGQERINPWLVWITMLALIGGLAWLAINYWPETHSPPLDPELVRSAARAAASREAAQRDSAASEVLRLADDNAPRRAPARYRRTRRRRCRRSPRSAGRGRSRAVA